MLIENVVNWFEYKPLCVLAVTGGIFYVTYTTASDVIKSCCLFKNTLQNFTSSFFSSNLIYTGVSNSRCMDVSHTYCPI